MFEKKSNKDSNQQDSAIDVFRPSKGTAKVVIGNGVNIKGEINQADEVQIDGNAEVTMQTDNLVVGGTGFLKGNISTENADIWGRLEGDVKISGTLTVQEQGNVAGKIEYQNLQIKLGGKVRGEIKDSDKVKKISDHLKKDDAQPLQDVLKDKKST